MESRLKELERNIAVARQFIKLADETYSQVRHEWDLLQQDVRTRQPETFSSPFSEGNEEKKHERDHLEEGFGHKDKAKSHFSEDTESDFAHTSMKPSNNPSPSKKHNKKDETRPADEPTVSSITSKTLQKSRIRSKK